MLKSEGVQIPSNRGNQRVNRPPIDILGLSFDDFAGEFEACCGKGFYHARAVYRHVFQQGTLDLSRLPEFAGSQRLAMDVRRSLVFNPGTVVDEKRQARLLKFVTRLDDGHKIESVIVPMATHTTLCISCQAGCRMGCRFCATARLGLRRNLTAAEMVGQVANARFKYGVAPHNIVFMGMGEPLDNFENVIRAIGVISDQRGLDIAPRHITVSTVGLADGIGRLGAMDGPRPNLAISINAADDATRSRIMPVNQTFPLAALKRAMAAYPLGRKESLFIGYVLIDGLNDSRQDALRLADYLGPFKVKVNLIPCNTGENMSFRPPPARRVLNFRDWLVEKGVFVRLRSARGGEISAACGQLGGGDRYGPGTAHPENREVSGPAHGFPDQKAG